MDVLKKKSDVGPFGSQGISFPSVLFSGSWSGEGHTSMMNSISLLVPMSFLPERQNTGYISPFMNPIFSPLFTSSSERVPSAKNFSINASSFSAAISISAAFMSSAWPANSAGISFSSRVPFSSLKMYCFIFRMSMNPLKADPVAVGNCSTTGLLPNA